MMKFKITYPSGLIEEVEVSDVETLEGFINTKFGISAEDVAAHGTLVEVVTDEAPVETTIPAVAEATAEEPAA
jgi:hypothetical protein